eukprot:m.9864 g.9864  ORF g.9864 m.9864 type:complete len:219 (-) comp4154_c0_seq1:365-1021(-)
MEFGSVMMTSDTWEQERELLRESYTKRMVEADADRDRCYAAAVVIQRNWRIYAAKLHLERQHKAAIVIQRNFRSLKAKIERRKYVIRQLLLNRQASYAKAATMVQALWRGYRSRKKIHSFYDRKKFLQEVQEKNEQTLKSMNTFRASEELRLTEEQHRRQKQAYERRLSREHHLLSTTAMKGVYARPLAPVLEDDLRKTSKLQQTLLLSHLSIGTSKV